MAAFSAEPVNRPTGFPSRVMTTSSPGREGIQELRQPGLHVFDCRGLHGVSLLNDMIADGAMESLRWQRGYVADSSVYRHLRMVSL